MCLVLQLVLRSFARIEFSTKFEDLSWSIRTLEKRQWLRRRVATQLPSFATTCSPEVRSSPTSSRSACSTVSPRTRSRLASSFRPLPSSRSLSSSCGWSCHLRSSRLSWSSGTVCVLTSRMSAFGSTSSKEYHSCQVNELVLDRISEMNKLANKSRVSVNLPIADHI